MPDNAVEYLFENIIVSSKVVQNNIMHNSFLINANQTSNLLTDNSFLSF